MRAALQDLGDEPPRSGADLLGPADEPRRGPLGMRPVGAGQVRRLGRGLPVLAPPMRRQRPALVEELDGHGGVARLAPLVEELEENAVGVACDLDVVIDVDATGRPLREGVTSGREGPERWAVESLVARAPADAEPLQRAVVHRVEQRPDRGVQRRETEDGLVPQPGEDPPLCHQYARLDRCLVPGLRGARRDHDRAIVRSELPRRCD